MTTTCDHCDAARREQRQRLDEFRRDAFPLYRQGEPDQESFILHLWRVAYRRGDPTMAACPCGCHTCARIVGLLPRLAAVGAAA